MRRRISPTAFHTPNKSSDRSDFSADHSWRQQNHIWTEGEVTERMKTADMKHVPQDTADSVLQKMVRVAYHTFNFMTGYNHADPPTSAIGYRLIILESVAGVPRRLAVSGMRLRDQQCEDQQLRAGHNGS